MTREEMLQKMTEAGVGKSALHMRSESIQQRNQVKRIPGLKKKLKKKSKLLIIADLALPFNPETGAEDDTFNVDNKFRPTFSATTTALMLKASADENETLKKALMKRARVTEWDTSGNTLTEEDKKVFAQYRVPRIFTVPVVHVDIPVMTGNDFGKDYAISVQYDHETGEIVGEVPGVLKVSKLFNDRNYEEIADHTAKIQSGEIHETEKQQQEFRTSVYQKTPVSDVHPSNWVTAIELPLTNNYKLTADIDYAEIDTKGIRQQLIATRLSSKMKQALDNYHTGAWEKFDECFDFYAVDMACPTEGDETSNTGKQQIGLNTAYEKPSFSLEECLDTGVDKTRKAIQDFIDETTDIENEVRRSMFIGVYTPEVESQIFQSLYTVLDIEKDVFLTQKVIEANKEVINLAFAGEGAALLDDIAAGVSSLDEGALDAEKSAAAAKSYNLDSADFVDSEDDEIALESTEIGE